MEFGLKESGRYLCLMYYKGALKPSRTYEKGSDLWRLSRCVEKPLEDSHENRGHTGEIWRQLMGGDLAKLNQMARSRLLGGGALNHDLDSIDGAHGVSIIEEGLYVCVGMEFKKLLKS